MNKKVVLTGAALGLVLVTAVTLAGCKNNNSGDGEGDPPIVSDVTVTPETVMVAKGGTKTFSAKVKGTDSPDETVTWSIETAKTAKGTQFEDNVLTIDTAETKKTITIKATSTEDTTVSGTATVTVVPADTTEETIAEANEFTADETVTEALAFTKTKLKKLDESALAEAKDIIQAALDVFDALSPEAQELLTTEKTKLETLLAAIVALGRVAVEILPRPHW
jgi:hypothetical protein